MLGTGTSIRTHVRDTMDLHGSRAKRQGWSRIMASWLRCGFGEISFVTPFRYARLLFAMVVGITIFGERLIC